MCVAIGNVGGGATILTGVSDLLTQGLLQGGDTGQVLGEQGDIVDPTLATVGCVVAINGSHGNGYQEGVGGGYDHFGNGSFYNQIQAQSQVGCLGLAEGIGRSHCGAAVSSHVLFQSILDGGGVGFQTCSQGIDQNIGLVEVLAGIQLVSIGVTLSAVLQTQSLQKICTLDLVDAISSGMDSSIGTFSPVSSVSNVGSVVRSSGPMSVARASGNIPKAVRATNRNTTIRWTVLFIVFSSFSCNVKNLPYKAGSLHYLVFRQALFGAALLP